MRGLLILCFIILIIQTMITVKGKKCANHEDACESSQDCCSGLCEVGKCFGN